MSGPPRPDQGDDRIARYGCRQQREAGERQCGAQGVTGLSE
jgi:hypothetical protein